MKSLVTYKKLVDVLRHYSTGKDEEYDVVGVLHLLKSCTNNIIQNQEKLDVKSIRQELSTDQKTYLREMVNAIIEQK